MRKSIHSIIAIVFNIQDEKTSSSSLLWSTTSSPDVI